MMLPLFVMNRRSRLGAEDGELGVNNDDVIERVKLRSHLINAGPRGIDFHEVNWNAATDLISRGLAVFINGKIIDAGYTLG